MSMTEQEARDKCFGQETCQECGRFMDDCDGKEEEHEEVKENVL